MTERRRCTTCRTVMAAIETILPEGNALNLAAGSVLVYYRCPNATGMFDTHVPVSCPNCGEDVPAQQFHWYSREGVLGSGRWSCTPTRERERALKFIDDTVKRLNDKESDATEA